MIGTAEAIIFPFLHTRCIFLTHFSILCALERQQYSLVTNKTHGYAHTGRHIYRVHTYIQADTAFWLGFIQGSSGGSPSSAGRACMSVCARVHGRVSACEAGAHQYLLILVPRVTPHMSHPITFSVCWRTQPASVCVCRCLSFTSSCVALTWGATSIRLWFDWVRCYFHHAQGQFSFFCFSQRYRLISLFFLSYLEVVLNLKLK